MKEIVLTDGQITTVDEDDFYWLNQWVWHASRNKFTTYVVRGRRNNHLGLSNMAYIHRIIMRVEDSKIIVDHIDGNPLNNCKSNLRICTHQQNCLNKKKTSKPSSSKYLGVSFSNEKQKWCAQLKNKDYRFMKRFNTELEAALAYDEQAKIYHGEFANLNFKNN